MIESEENQEIRKALRRWRLKSELTQLEISQFIGVSRPVYNTIESGKREITMAEIVRLCNGCNVTINQIFEK